MKPTDTVNSNFIGIATVHVWDGLSAHHQEFLVVFGIGIYCIYEGWNFNSGNYLFTTDTK